MSKAFTRDHDENPADTGPPRRALELPPGTRNYLTVAGARRLRDELDRLTRLDRPEAAHAAAVISDSPGTPTATAARHRLHAIDARIHELTEHLDAAEVVDPATQPADQVRFGASVTVVDDDDREQTFRIVGLPEADPRRGEVSWLSPVAVALLGKEVGDVVTLPSPHGPTEREIVRIRYES
jgi:transcription elongation factor GreB